jgi:DNA-binding beta-propeller fold protein YncE
MKAAAQLATLLAALAVTVSSSATTAVVPKAPAALAFGPNGNLYIADDGRNQILERLSNGSFVVFASGLHQPGGIAFSPDGTMYVADAGSGRVLAVSASGRISTVAGNGRAGWVETGTPALKATLGWPSDVAFAPNRRLVIAVDMEVLELGADGMLARLAGNRHYDGVFGIGRPALAASADSPNGLAFDRRGNLFVAGFATKALLRITPAGTMRLVSDAFYPRGDAGLATAPNGQVLAMETQRIVRVTPDGISSVFDFGSRKVPGLRGGFLPHGIAVSRNGDVYLDTAGGNGWGDRAMLLVVHPNGRFRVLWAAPR